MNQFLDNRNRPWSIAINIAAAKRVKTRLGVDLYASVSGGMESLKKLLSDPITLVDVIYVLCQEAAEAQKVTDEDFGAALAGDAIEHATNVFLQALCDFFPDARTRATLRKLIEKSKEMRDLILDRAVTEAESLDVQSMISHLTSSSTKSPALSESTPAL